MALKAQAELMEPFVTLSGVKEGKKGSEGVGNGRRAEVIFLDLKHLEPLSIKDGSCVLKEEPNGTILEGGTQLALPVLTC
jgi:hypothetical protein